MNKFRNILILCLLVFSQTLLRAQTYERIYRNNFWNGTDNVTGVRQDSLSSSFAEIYGLYEGGGFKDTWEAEEGWSAGAATASIRHLERLSLAGSFSFSQTEGYGMCGSMFIRPGFYPVDVMEFTPGRKTLQQYGFDGGISYDIAPRWRIGAEMEFESANLSKRKDLRHTNWRLDMEVAPGFMFHDGDFAAGAAAIFVKTSESVDAEQVGTSESSYYAFLDKGLMYGTYSVWTGNGLHLDELGLTSFPVREFSYGGSLQLQYKGLFADLKYLRSYGSVGEKEYIWFSFPGNTFRVNLAYRLRPSDGAHGDHFFRLSYLLKDRTMSESVLEKVASNGVTTVYNHGWNRIYADAEWSVTPEYEYVSERWESRVYAELSGKTAVSSQIYPYIYIRSLMSWQAHAEFILHGIGRFDLCFKVGYGGASCTEADRLATEDSGVQTSPFRLQEWYDMQMDYIEADRIHAGISARYRIYKGIYTEIGGNLTRGFGFESRNGAYRYGAALKIGYQF